MSKANNKCNYCNITVDENHWAFIPSKQYKIGGTWKCKEMLKASRKRYRDSHKEQQRIYQKAYRLKHPEIQRYKAYRHFDIKNNFNTVERKYAINLMKKDCYYCGIKNSGGLDRRNSNYGHSKDNTVACCEKCNYILGDIPFEAKEYMRYSLQNIKRSKLLKDWVIPTKRRNKKWK